MKLRSEMLAVWHGTAYISGRARDMREGRGPFNLDALY